jgi:hypothetical protein
MTRNLGPKGPQHELAKHGTRIETLARRPAPTPAPNTIHLLTATSATTTSGSGLTTISWVVETAYSDLTYLDVVAGNVNVLGAGVYLWHVVASPSFASAGVDTVMWLQWDVTSGAQGTWSSKYPPSAPAEGFAEWGGRINQTGTGIDARVGGQGELFAITAWSSAETFPVVVRTQVDVQENKVSVARVVNTRITVARIGTPLE